MHIKNANNVNTESYWENRFRSGDWEMMGGNNQTKLFAQSQIPFFHMTKKFSGVICDFGCGAGDAFPLYKASFPNAKLIGIDFSESAIKLCRQKYGSFATFILGDVSVVPSVDVIIASNVLEHLSDDKNIAKILLGKCNYLYVIVPFREQLNLEGNSEHINTYDLNSFNYLRSPLRKKIFISKGWDSRNFYQIEFKNIFRFLLCKEIKSRQKQILFQLIRENIIAD